MASFRFTPQGISFQLAANVGRILDEAEIPNVLWGAMAMRLLLNEGYSFHERLQFIVPDHLLVKATQALLDVGFPRCPSGDERMYRNPKFSVPLADAHHHLRPERPHLAVILYTKSAVFWAGRDIPLCTPLMDDPDFMLTTDYRTPSVDLLGRPLYPADLYPLKILTGSCFLETVILLACRDYKHANGFDRVWWDYLFDLADDTHLAGLINTDYVDPRFLPFWTAQTSWQPGTIYPALQRLREKLLAKAFSVISLCCFICTFFCLTIHHFKIQYSDWQNIYIVG